MKLAVKLIAACYQSVPVSIFDSAVELKGNWKLLPAKRTCAAAHLMVLHMTQRVRMTVTIIDSTLSLILSFLQYYTYTFCHCFQYSCQHSFGCVRKVLEPFFLFPVDNTKNVLSYWIENE